MNPEDMEMLEEIPSFLRNKAKKYKASEINVLLAGPGIGKTRFLGRWFAREQAFNGGKDYRRIKRLVGGGPAFEGDMGTEYQEHQLNINDTRLAVLDLPSSTFDKPDRLDDLITQLRRRYMDHITSTKDNRVHVCLYFVESELTEQDINIFKRLAEFTYTVPIVARADLQELADLQKLRESINNTLGDLKLSTQYLKLFPNVCPLPRREMEEYADAVEMKRIKAEADKWKALTNQQRTLLKAAMGALGSGKTTAADLKDMKQKGNESEAEGVGLKSNGEEEHEEDAGEEESKAQEEEEEEEKQKEEEEEKPLPPKPVTRWSENVSMPFSVSNQTKLKKDGPNLVDDSERLWDLLYEHSILIRKRINALDKIFWTKMEGEHDKQLAEEKKLMKQCVMAIVGLFLAIAMILYIVSGVEESTLTSKINARGFGHHGAGSDY